MKCRGVEGVFPLDSILYFFDLTSSLFSHYISDMKESLINHVCYYCGMPAEEEDHVVPRAVVRKSLVGAFDPDAYNDVIKRRGLTVPVCKECNHLLHDSYQRTLEGRKRQLKQKLRQKYKKLLKMPNWGERDLSELGETLRSHIEMGLADRDILRHRIKW